ncbi:hypothetical protein [Nitrosomonas ureae]|nr:hypothetical protein [Nitrosomonas ureae]
MAASKLMMHMFYIGLPLRGVIHEGEFIIQHHCLTSKAVVDSYRLCEKLNFSGLVCSHEFAFHFRNELRNTPITQVFLFEYLTPLKNNDEDKLLNVNWVLYTEFDHDIEDMVLYKF